MARENDAVAVDPEESEATDEEEAQEDADDDADRDVGVGDAVAPAELASGGLMCGRRQDAPEADEEPVEAGEGDPRRGRGRGGPAAGGGLLLRCRHRPPRREMFRRCWGVWYVHSDDWVGRWAGEKGLG